MRGYVDIPYHLLNNYMQAVEKKKGTCKVLPDGRFSCSPSELYYSGLVCSDDMKGKCTGVGAESCKNCTREKENE